MTTVAEPGDLILVRSPGRIFALGRRLAGNAYDHVAIVVEGGETVNIDKPRVRCLPVERLLRASLAPLVLRPGWQHPDERRAFLAWTRSLLGRPYDRRRTYGLVPRLLARRLTGIAVPLAAPRVDQSHWICTDAVLLGLERCRPGFAAVRGLELDWVRLRCGSTNDFLRIHEARPDLLARVESGAA